MQAEALEILRCGIAMGMFSEPGPDGLPKYVWSLDDTGETYEAKLIPGTKNYKGYRFEEEDPMRADVLKSWKRRIITT